jgi:hypothetical protein
MKTISLAFLILTLLACQTEAVSGSTPSCDNDLGTGWGKDYGVEVESQSNLDSDRCVTISSVWCCAL